MTAEVVVVGAGPAGLTAALEASAAGCAVTVLDAGAGPGGQYYRQPSISAGAPAPELLRRVDADRFITVVQHTTVYGAERLPAGGAVLRTLGPDDIAGRLVAPAVVLATGAFDRVLPFPGWTLPGVFTAGGAQALVKGQGVLPGARVAVAGTGPFLLPVAVELACAGARVVGVYESSSMTGWIRQTPAVARNPSKVVEAVHYGRVLARHRIPLHRRHAVIAADGGDAVDAITVSRLRPDWTPIPGTQRRIVVDAVCIGFGFVPSVELALTLGCEVRIDGYGSPAVSTTDHVRTSATGIFCAGEVSGVGGVVLAEAEGALAGMAAATAVGCPVSTGHRRSRSRERARAAHFAAALEAVHPVQPGWTSWLSEDTLACRCEEVPVRRIREAVRDGDARDLRSVKLHTRAGMGMCQGRMCGPAVAGLVRDGIGTPPKDADAYAHRPFVVPVPLSSLARGIPPEPGPPNQIADG